MLVRDITVLSWNDDEGRCGMLSPVRELDILCDDLCHVERIKNIWKIEKALKLAAGDKKIKNLLGSRG